ncbi:MASE1 domain-containing protein [Streptomyces halobius]|uniref:MASE1 domain-containing protein n=1 Tax=Streptomyces halobius TaxID=2879846 RepID=A0ABY4MLP2_9ACTN|nr:MASE1 domain-containing protein [Streptomyces halobius]UQA97604.1 MASE1 domain-containing protein [Streptomyces halobius]
MVRTEEFRRLAAAVLKILAFAAVYFASAKVGLLQQVMIGGAVVTPLWPPTGIALSCLLYLGLWTWPGIAVGTLLVVWSLGPLDAGVLGIMAGNTLGPVCSYLMLRRIGFHVAMDRLRDGVALVALGAFAGMLVSATGGGLTLLVTDSLPPGGFWPAWVSWWVGDAMGVLVVTPLLLAFRRFRLPRDVRPHRWFEAAALAAATVVVSVLTTTNSLSLLFLVFPLIVWAALRFQLAGAAPCVLVLSVLAITAATAQTGPFSRHSHLQAMVNLQALNGSAALTALLLSAIVTEQKSIRQKIEQVCLDLSEVVDRLAPGESGRRWPPEGDEQ